MNLKKNEIEIIKLLISSPNYISSYDIATATGINRRLVRDEMVKVKTILKSLGYELVSKTSKGYIIEGESSHSLQELADIVEEAERQRETVFPTLPWERQNFIIKYLIESNDYVKIDDLAEQLLISRSTISSDLKQAKKDIKKYGLSFKQKPNYGICIIGDEINKRKPICDFLFTNLKESEMFYDYLNSYFNDKDSLEYGIIRIIKEHQVEMSDFALCDFLLSLSVSLTRIFSGSTIQEPQDLSYIEGRSEFLAARDIAQFIEEKVQCHMNEYEINQMAIELICKRSSKGVQSMNDSRMESIIDEILDEIENQTLLQLNTSSFRKVFTLYVEAAFIRMFYKEKVRNPLYDKLKDAYPLAYECAQITSTIISKYTHQSLSRSELAFFSIIFHKAIYNHDSIKKRVLLVCGLGGGAGDLSRYQILERFENKIQIVKRTPYYKIYDEDLTQYDLIISTVPIHHKLSIPHINISQIIASDDLDRIDHYLSYLFDQNKIETLFHPQLFKAHVKARSKSEVVNEFYKLLKSQYPQIKESFKNNLLTKEQRSFTLYGSNIATIRLNKPFNNNNVISVLMLNKPIIWKKQEIQIIILFSCQETNNNIFNTVANALTNLSQDADAITAMYEEATYQSLIKTLIKYQ